MLSAVNQVFAVELCIPHRIRCSLPNLCYPQRIRCPLPNSCCLQRIKLSLPNYIVHSELGFAAEVVLSAAEVWFAVETSCLQRISIRCLKCVGCSEVAFASEIVVPAAKQFSLSNCAACSEPVFTVELYGLQRINFRCWIVWPVANQFRCRFSTIDPPGRNDLNACNNFIVWWCKMWNTWMWTYGLLK